MCSEARLIAVALLQLGHAWTPAVRAARVPPLYPLGYRDIVLINSAAALIVGGKAHDLREGVRLAAAAIDTGKAQATLEKLVAISKAEA